MENNNREATDTLLKLCSYINPYLRHKPRTHIITTTTPSFQCIKLRKSL